MEESMGNVAGSNGIPGVQDTIRCPSSRARLSSFEAKFIQGEEACLNGMLTSHGHIWAKNG